MKNRFYEEYYVWCCDWCDSENRVFRGQTPEGVTCGACHRPMNEVDRAVALNPPHDEAGAEAISRSL